MSESPAPQRGYLAGDPGSPTVREIFALPEPGSPEQSEGWKKFEEKISRELKSIKAASMPDLAAKIRELFDIPIPDIFFTSWTKANVLQNFLTESQKDPETVMELELAEHTINSQHRPHIEVCIKDTPDKRIDFTLRLIFRLKGFVLKIQDGAIKEMRTGRCDARGTLEYHGLVIAEKMLAPINLPAIVSVPASIPSPPVLMPSKVSIPSTAAITSEGPMPSRESRSSEGSMPSDETGTAGIKDNEQRPKESTEQPMVSKASGAAH